MYSLYTFAVPTSRSEGALKRVLEGLQRYIPSPPREISISWHGKGQTIRHGGTMLDLATNCERALRAYKGCARLELHMQARFPFGEDEIVLYYDKLIGHEVLSLYLSTPRLLHTRSNKIRADNFDALCKIGCDMFDAGGFLNGILLDDEGISGLEGPQYVEDPPVDWCYWSSDVIRRLPAEIVEQTDAQVAECLSFGNGSRYWRWDEYGQEVWQTPSPKQKQLQTALRRALHELQREPTDQP